MVTCLNHPAGLEATGVRGFIYHLHGNPRRNICSVGNGSFKVYSLHSLDSPRAIYQSETKSNLNITLSYRYCL